MNKAFLICLPLQCFSRCWNTSPSQLTECLFFLLMRVRTIGCFLVLYVALMLFSSLTEMLPCFTNICSSSLLACDQIHLILTIFKLHFLLLIAKVWIHSFPSFGKNPMFNFLNLLCKPSVKPLTYRHGEPSNNLYHYEPPPLLMEIFFNK